MKRKLITPVSKIMPELQNRLSEAEKAIESLKSRCAVLSLVADILAERNIVSEGDIEAHVEKLREKLKNPTGIAPSDPSDFVFDPERVDSTEFTRELIPEGPTG